MTASLPLLRAEQVQARFTAGVTSFVDEAADNHATFGGSVRFYFSRRWSVEPEYLYLHTSRRHDDHIVWGNIAYDFVDPNRKFVPYLFASPGYIHSTSRFGNLRFTNNEAAVSAGFGARFFLNDRVFVGPQVRAGIADSFFGEVTGSIGFVVRK